MGIVNEFVRRRQRRVDVKVLWPAIKARASTLADARTAFALHAQHDKAWREMDPRERQRIIRELA